MKTTTRTRKLRSVKFDLLSKPFSADYRYENTIIKAKLSGSLDAIDIYFHVLYYFFNFRNQGESTNYFSVLMT